ncbi:MAG TPA: transcriptional repressor [Candidatus Udaeobacter sp.]|nr:transcriptional repressor [Candidatus Udaeobacter sp.]
MSKEPLGKDNKLELLETLCRQRRVPVTVQRRVILSALVERHDHPTIDQVFEDVKSRLPGVSRTTVYRVLETLVELGMAKRTQHFEAAARFDGNTDHHDHLVCIRCSKVVDFDDPKLGGLPLPDPHRTGFEVIDFSVYFEGVCSNCKARAKVHSRKRPRPGRRTVKTKRRQKRRGIL